MVSPSELAIYTFNSETCSSVCSGVILNVIPSKTLLCLDGSIGLSFSTTILFSPFLTFNLPTINAGIFSLRRSLIPHMLLGIQ